jgi:hypothetical protein
MDGTEDANQGSKEGRKYPFNYGGKKGRSVMWKKGRENSRPTF